MTDLEKKLVEALEKAIAAAEKSGEFVLDYAPEIVQEFYRWEILSSTLWLLFLLSFYGLIYAVYRITPEGWSGYADRKYDFAMAAVIYSLFAIPVMCINISNLLHILVAPKLYLLKKVISIVS